MDILTKIRSGNKLKIEMSPRDKIKELITYAVSAFILYMFFRSLFAFLFLPVMIYFYHRYYKKQLIQKKNEKMNLQFKDAIKALAAALRAGKSAENALKESLREMLVIYGTEEPISREMTIMVNQVSFGIPLEKALEDFALRNPVEDIHTFVSVFQIAKRTGGDLVEIIQNTAESISDKIDTRNEISVVIHSKKLEQKIMSVMPLGILCYIQLAAPDMLTPLYGNVKGLLIMLVCLLIYGAAYFLSVKIMDIEV